MVLKKKVAKKQAQKKALEIAGVKEGVEEFDLFSRRGQIERFWQEQPFYYDSSKLFWLWDKEKFKWILSDETDFCNLIYETLGVETISTKSKSELVEGFKQVGRKHKPREIDKTWIQFKDKIHDVKTGQVFEATPEYFITNPIPYAVGKTDRTPEIDRLFYEWVNQPQQLYELTAYSITPDKFMQRIFALCGGGSNGKGTFIKFLYKFIGEGNAVASELKELSENRFEPAVLYRKLLCVMGEVSYDDLRNTNMLKKIAGEDKLSFQFKGKTPFTDNNTATAVCLTNSLPVTPDKSVGFYRKWHIIDFPNQFSAIAENPIDRIPEKEFSNLALKCLNILKGLYENPKFTDEGNFEDRIKRYEERSNPIQTFVEEHCVEEEGSMLPLREFTTKCNEYLKSKHLRIMTARQIGFRLREDGFIEGSRKVDGTSTKVVLNLRFKEDITKKTTETTETTESLTQNIHEEMTSTFGSSGSSGGNQLGNLSKYGCEVEKIR